MHVNNNKNNKRTNKQKEKNFMTERKIIMLNIHYINYPTPYLRILLNYLEESPLMIVPILMSWYSIFED